MEHRDEAIRDVSSQDWRSMSHETAEAFVLGYRCDAARNVFYVPTRGRWEGQERRMPLNRAGFDEAAAVIQGMHDRIRKVCLKRLKQHFTAHPETIPPFREIGATVQEVMEPIEGEGPKDA